MKYIILLILAISMLLESVLLPKVYLKKTNRSKSSGSDAGEPIAGAPTSAAPTPYEPFHEQFGSPPTPAASGGDADASMQLDSVLLPKVYLKKTNRSKSSGSDAGEPIA